MKRIQASSTQSALAQDLVSGLQRRFVHALERTAAELGKSQIFSAVEWFRDGGQHGGGTRFETMDGSIIGRGSVNVSQVHYDDDPSKALGSATAISTIIHPNSPHAPSVHIHISWTAMKNGQGYWRIMADLNPAIEQEAASSQFLEALQQAAPHQFDDAKKQGEQYFFIPALQRHRGTAHFYLEAYHTDNNQADLALARIVGEVAIDTYVAILKESLSQDKPIQKDDHQTQLAYHTLYFFQVLTLDRGTTSGLLVHDQNDQGILGSLPAHVDVALLHSWVSQLEPPQNSLLQGLIDALPLSSPCLIDQAVKLKLAKVVRQHYLAHPEAIAMQASGHIIPPTVLNHHSS